MVNTRPYVTVLKDLSKRRESLSETLKKVSSDIEELDSLIAGLRKLSRDSAESKEFPMEVKTGAPKKMSMRWNILKLLGYTGACPMSVTDIVEALKTLGFEDNSKLRGNVSAVLSRMVAARELSNAGNSYTITDQGKSSLGAIEDNFPVAGASAGNMELYSDSAESDEEGD
jgi:hypothetical protein